MLLKKSLAEFIGTFILVFCGTGAIVINEESGGTVTHVGIALSFGFAVLAMIYAIGDKSGAHINPAVTIALCVANKFESKKALSYIAAQLIGAILASETLHLLFPGNNKLGATIPSGSDTQSLLLEIILMFILMFTILCFLQHKAEYKITAPLAIAGVVALEAMFAGPISGASMNPARSLAPAIVSGNLQHVWIYIVAPIVGACLAVIVYKPIEKISHD